MPDQDTPPRRLSDAASFFLILLVSGVAFLWWSQKSDPLSVLATEQAVAVNDSTVLVCPFGEAVDVSTSSDEAKRLMESISADDISGPRIVALMPFAADQLLEMGVTPVGVPSLRGPMPHAWHGIPTIQLDHSVGPNLEQLLACQPDVIVTPSTYLQFVDVISDMTKAEVVVMDVASIADVFQNIRELGQMANVPLVAEQLCSSVQSSLNQKASLKEPIDVLAIFGTPHSFFAFLPNSYLGDLVRYAGGTVGPDGLGEHRVYKGLAPLTMESVVEFDPDALLVLFHGPEESSRAMFENDPLWSDLRAIRQGHVKYISDDLYAMRPGSDLQGAIAEIQLFLGRDLGNQASK
ncbi:MAG: ABC transporter substrate-binding protein [Planctomycetota bacterium]|nr:ABC transporter substrate-binding protein [Planctomycetota bacterium]